MTVQRRFLAPIAACVLLVAAGCARGTQSTESASPEPSAAASVAVAASAAPEAAATPLVAGATSAPTGPTPTPTPVPNLLSWESGTIVRSYPAALTDDPQRVAEHSFTAPTGAMPTETFVFELPTQVQFTSFSAALPVTASGGTAASVAFAVAADGANGSFQNVGTITGDTSDQTKTLTANVKGRWVRVSSNGAPFEDVAAAGTLPKLPSGASPAGIFVELDDSPFKAGAFLNQPTAASPWYQRIATVDSGMSGARCFDGHVGDPYPGTFDGRVWSFTDGASTLQAVVNDETSLIVVNRGNAPLYLARVDKKPKYCLPITTGSGPHHVLVLDDASIHGLWPIEDTALPGYTYTRIYAPMLDRSMLAGQDMAILNGMCDPTPYMSKPQTDALLQWVQAGHKLLIYDADMCQKSAYAFLPYPFTTSNPGAKGASGDRLIVVESDALGTTDAHDAHFFDPAKFINNGSNQLGDANVVTTQDSHWCGHLFGTNANNDNGFMQMYAPYGQGIIIYDGFDHDDGGNPGYQRVRTLEFELPVPAGMPCTAPVAGAFIVEPSDEGTFTTGKAQTLPFKMETLASLGWKGHVTISTVGPFKTDVTPSSFDLAGTSQPMKLAVSVPASAQAGVYTINVTGNDGQGHTAQASITLTAIAALKKKITKHERIRVYGIHFDVDSAHIQPQSEKVVKQIADLMKANPTVRFQVEGHTDSDGGAVYNLGLSQRRAQSVVNDLVTRYGIARSRMVPKGFGLTEPVKPNTTAANKALNRRVELLAL